MRAPSMIGVRWSHYRLMCIKRAIGMILGCMAFNMSHAYLQSDYEKALSTCHCTGCDLRGAKLSHLKCSGGDFSHANLTGACLAWSDYSHAHFHHANLRGANLYSARFISANFTASTLSSATMTYATFIGAIFSGADFSNANISHSNFYEAVITGKQIEQAASKTAIIAPDYGDSDVVQSTF